MDLTTNGYVLTKNVRWNFFEWDLFEIWTMWFLDRVLRGPQEILRHLRRCKIKNKRLSVFFTFGPKGLENPFLAKKEIPQIAYFLKLKMAKNRYF